jgi:hypothetical protein
MAIPFVLLPLLFAGADPKVIAVGDHQRLEAALSDQLRERIAAGWTVIDARSLPDEFVVTLRKADAFEKHIVQFDTQRTYRIENAPKEPADPNEPSEFLLHALAAPRGGLEVTATCGGYTDRAYLIDDEAAGEFATTLASRALSTADEITAAFSHAGRVTFTLRKKGIERDLVVWLDPKGNVLEAQLRRFESGGAGAKYARTAELKNALAKTRVTSVVGSGTTLALVTPKGRFLIDPKGNAFDYSESYGEGCGC